MTYKLLKKETLQLYFDEFIPVKSNDIVKMIHDYYQYTEELKNFMEDIKDLLPENFENEEKMRYLFSNIPDNDLSDVKTFLKEHSTSVNIMNITYCRCLHCDQIYIKKMMLVNNQEKYKTDSELCSCCQRNLCYCEKIMNDSVITYFIQTKKTKKCHLCQQYKCTKHLFHEQNDTICKTCCNHFTNFMKTLL